MRAGGAERGGAVGVRACPFVRAGAEPSTALRRSSVGVVANTSRTVSLNWRMLGKPAANATSVNGSVGRLDQQAGGLGALGAGERERAGAELGDELAVQVALAEAEPPREAGDALALDHAVADQPHRAADRVGAQVPLRRAGRGVGAAALAGAEAGALGGGGARA